MKVRTNGRRSDESLARFYTIGDKAKNVTPQVIHVEGDPDCPTNRGTLCPKGSSLEQDILNPRRLMKPQVRRPGATAWEDISWDQALDEIAQWTKKTPDATFVEKNVNGRTVNRCEGISFIGGCTDTNEFNLPGRKDDEEQVHRLPGVTKVDGCENDWLAQCTR